MIWGPLAMGYAQVDADYRAAVARQARVTAKVDLLAAPVDAAASNVPVDALARDSAAEIGITLDRNDPRPPGRTTVAIAAIRSQALLPWLDSLERQGVVIDQLTVTPSPDRTLSVVADLRRAP
jgi:general secretion pathway protein M